MSGSLGPVKIVLISLGVLSTAILINSKGRDFAATRFPVFRNMVLAWMKPPLLFVVLNGIILILALSVKLFDQDAGVLLPPAPAMPAPVPATYLEEEVDILMEGADGDFQEVHVVVEDRSNSVIGRDDGSLEAVDGHNLGGVRPPVTVRPKGNLVKDNPPRFIQVKSIAGSVEVNDTRVLRTSKSHRYSSPSMDSVWRAITSSKENVDDDFNISKNFFAPNIPLGQYTKVDEEIRDAEGQDGPSHGATPR